MFNPETFLDQSYSDSNDTKLIPVPVGEYTGIIDSIKPRQWTKKDDPSVSGVTLEVLWIVDDTAVRELLSRDKVTVKQGIMLDFNEAGQLDFGKGRNVGLGRLREALDLNTPGQPFSFAMLNGRLGKITVSHRIDGENIYAEVKGVAKLA